MNKFNVLFLIPLLLAFSSSATLAKNDPPQTSIEGLELVDKDRSGEIYADSDIDWSEYSQIQLEHASVSFRKHWQRDQNRGDPFKVKDEDMERIKSDLADLFDEVFTEELSTKGGYTMSDASGDDVMTIIPHIVDLDVFAPDTQRAYRSQSYTREAGRMTLELEIHDSISGDLIAKLRHRQRAPDYGFMQWTTSVSNKAEARRMLQRWATSLRKRLDNARADKK